MWQFLSSNLLFGCLEPKLNLCLPNHCTTFCLTAKQVFPPTIMNAHNNWRKSDEKIAWFKNRNSVRLNGSIWECRKSKKGEKLIYDVYVCVHWKPFSSDETCCCSKLKWAESTCIFHLKSHRIQSIHLLLLHTFVGVGFLY